MRILVDVPVALQQHGDDGWFFTPATRMCSRATRTLVHHHEMPACPSPSLLEECTAVGVHRSLVHGTFRRRFSSVPFWMRSFCTSSLHLTSAGRLRVGWRPCAPTAAQQSILVRAIMKDFVRSPVVTTMFAVEFCTVTWQRLQDFVGASGSGTLWRRRGHQQPRYARLSFDSNDDKSDATSGIEGDGMKHARLFFDPMSQGGSATGRWP